MSGWEQVASYTIPGDPLPTGRPRCVPNLKSPITPPRTRAELNRLREYFGWFGPSEPWLGDLAVILRFYRSDRRAMDYDNLAKMVGDAGNKILWKDDAQIVRADITKILGVGAAAACIKLRILRPTAEARGQLL